MSFKLFPFERKYVNLQSNTTACDIIIILFTKWYKTVGKIMAITYSESKWLFISGIYLYKCRQF